MANATASIAYAVQGFSLMGGDSTDALTVGNLTEPFVFEIASRNASTFNQLQPTLKAIVAYIDSRQTRPIPFVGGSRVVPVYNISRPVAGLCW